MFVLDVGLMIHWFDRLLVSGICARRVSECVGDFDWAEAE